MALWKRGKQYGMDLIIRGQRCREPLDMSDRLVPRQRSRAPRARDCIAYYAVTDLCRYDVGSRPLRRTHQLSLHLTSRRG